MASALSTTSTILFLFIAFSVKARAAVPASAQFQYVNSGEFGPYIIEYDGSYRTSIGIFASPFQLCFYNTTPNSYTLALRMALRRSESLFRWVWEANRGHPVGENATFSLGADGNLVLADADGRVAWQTKTANKGVVGFSLLSTGNMVLYDSKGKYLWQSFDYPTDTLLVGQSLKVGGVTKLVSRVSESINADGPYSLVMEPKGLALYYTSKNSPKPLLYFNGWSNDPSQPGPLSSVTFATEPVDDGFAYEMTLDRMVGNSSIGSIPLNRPKFNATSSFLRLGIDGSIEVYTYNRFVDYGAWDRTFALFDRGNVILETECQLPERCGKFGLCSNSMCVACPTVSGLQGWSESCAPPKITSCKPSDNSYFKVTGVDHFLSKYTSGLATTESGCGAKCSSDCKCLGYFYNQQKSRCWIAYELKTLTEVANSTHVGYIKTPKK